AQEFDGGARVVPAEWLVAEGPVAPRRPGGEGSRGWARGVLVVGLLLVLLGALVRILGQGVGGFVR
ncbi:MAG: hypothetical protein ABL998_17840, partial [Planctomycetota bacterium]